MKLLTTDEEGNLIVDDTIFLYKEFSELLKFDKKGKIKLSHKILQFIHLMYSYSSEYVELADEDKVDMCLEDADVSVDEINNDVVKKAIDKFKSLQETTTGKAVESTVQLLRTILEAARKVGAYLGERLKLEEFTQGDVDDVLASMDKAMSVANKVPTLINTYLELKEKLKLEQKQTGTIRGDGLTGWMK